jgi:hypothetical protein
MPPIEAAWLENRATNVVVLYKSWLTIGKLSSLGWHLDGKKTPGSK